MLRFRANELQFFTPPKALSIARFGFRHRLSFGCGLAGHALRLQPPDLLFVNAMIYERDTFSRHHLLRVGLLSTAALLDLFRPAFFRSFPVLWGNSAWIDKLLRKSRCGEKGYRRQNAKMQK
jgi:hypothetical protein